MTASSPRLPACAGGRHHGPYKRRLTPVRGGHATGAAAGVATPSRFPPPRHDGDVERAVPGPVLVAAPVPARATVAAGVAA